MPTGCLCIHVLLLFHSFSPFPLCPRQYLQGIRRKGAGKHVIVFLSLIWCISHNERFCDCLLAMCLCFLSFFIMLLLMHPKMFAFWSVKLIAWKMPGSKAHTAGASLSQLSLIGLLHTFWTNTPENELLNPAKITFCKITNIATVITGTCRLQKQWNFYLQHT